jgi:uncharacterized protein YprB with RNaseH-like and TPR domain
MADFRTKLGRLRAPTGAGAAGASPAPEALSPRSSGVPEASAAIAREAPAPERVTALRELLARTVARQARPRAEPPVDAAARAIVADLGPAPRRAVVSALPGAPRETPHGVVHAVTRHCEPHHAHGRVRVADALDADPALVAKLALDPALAGRDVRRMLLVDTETTGLSGGTGTLPFLIGLAWFEDESLRVEQLLLPRPGAEAPMLREVAARIGAASMVVSYNGKSFDWPLLRTRFVMNRVPAPALPPHLDLLHCARRVFKRRLEGARLQQLEREVLGLHREDDIDGAEIPAAYLGWLREGDAARIAAVVEHNASDLVALAAVLAELVARFATLREEDDPRDHLSLAVVARRADDPGRAEAFARAAADGGGDVETTTAALEVLAALARERGDDREAVALLARAAAEASASGGGAARLHLQAAKLLEHRLRDPEAALEHARLGAAAEDPLASARRLARLERRLTATTRVPARRRAR